MRGFTARNTPCMGLVDRRPVVCRNLAMGFWVPLQWANGVLGGSAVFARAARRAPRDIPVMGEPGIGRIRGFCARRAPRDIPVMGEPGIGRIRGFCARGAPRNIPVMGEPGIGRIRGFCRAAGRAPREIPVMGEPGIGRIRGFCARRAPCAARHPRYGRAGYWADPRFLRAPRAARRAPRAARHLGYGRTGY